MSNDQIELEKELIKCVATIAAENEATFIAANMSEEDIKEELTRTIYRPAVYVALVFGQH